MTPIVNIMEVVYVWPDGRQEVRYRRTAGSKDAIALVAEVDKLQRQHGAACPYFYRHARQAEPLI